MNILLNVIVFFGFIWWFWKQFVEEKKKSFFGVIFLFLVAVLLVFVLSLYSESEYLDGLEYALAGGFSVIAFWLSTTAVIIWKNVKENTKRRMLTDLLQVLPLLLIPAIIWMTISTMSFKIGG